MFTEFPVDDVKAAVRLCLERRAFSDEAVRSILTFEPRRSLSLLDLSGRPELSGVGECYRSAEVYDGLLREEARS